MFSYAESIGTIGFLPILKAHHLISGRAAFLLCEFSGNRPWRSAI